MTSAIILGLAFYFHIGQWVLVIGDWLNGKPCFEKLLQEADWGVYFAACLLWPMAVFAIICDLWTVMKGK